MRFVAYLKPIGPWPPTPPALTRMAERSRWIKKVDSVVSVSVQPVVSHDPLLTDDDEDDDNENLDHGKVVFDFTVDPLKEKKEGRE